MALDMKFDSSYGGKDGDSVGFVDISQILAVQVHFSLERRHFCSVANEQQHMTNGLEGDTGEPTNLFLFLHSPLGSKVKEVNPTPLDAIYCCTISVFSYTNAYHSYSSYISFISLHYIALFFC